MKARNPLTGNFEEVYVKALDSMPVGTQIEYTGSTIPTGWEQVNDYSTTEIDTGKRWVDGKKIYRKVIEINQTFSAASWKEISYTTLGLSNIDSIIVTNGIYTKNSTTKEALFGDGNRVQYLTNKISFYTTEQFTDLTIIVEYTKSS